MSRVTGRMITAGTCVWLVSWASVAFARSDIDRLSELHEKVIRAHQQSKVSLLLEDEAADYVVANRGEVTRPSLDERRRKLEGYLGRTRFEIYRDMAEPTIKVSSDGTLGWVMVQVQARGVQTTTEGGREPLEFVSAWIELYEKRDGRWLRVGNVSNFRP